MVDSDQSYYTEPKRDLWALGMIICDMFGKSSNTIVAGMDDQEAANVIVAWLPAGPEPGELDSFEAGEMNSFERDLRAPKAEDFPDAGDLAHVAATLGVAFKLTKSRPCSRLSASGAADKLL